MSHELWLVRHGQSEGNARSIRQGQSDFKLTPFGRSQMTSLAGFLAESDIHFDRIISSPLTRAFESAKILADALGLQIKTDDLWQERNSGEAEGTPIKKLHARDPDSRDKLAHEAIFPGGESELQLHIRAASAVQDLLSQEPGRYLIVSHGGILNAVLHVILGLAPSAANKLPGFRFDNSGYAVLQHSPKHRQWRIEKINARNHLASGD